jgi:hypothetical protein
LSTPADDLGERPRASGFRLKLALRAISLVLALASLIVLWSGERVRVRHDLQIVVDPSARPSATLAVRALVFRDVEAPEGPTLAKTDVQVRMLDSEGRELSRSVLRPTILDTMEGQIRLPDAGERTITLEARAQLDDDPELVCRRVVSITAHPPPLTLQGRTAGPLQQLALGNVVRSGLTLAPSPLLPRVLGGACVPEQRCQVLVWVGEPAAAVTLRPDPAITLLGEPVPSGPTSGLVELSLRVHGLEANVVLEARRGSELVAQRSLRLPIALGEVALSLERSLVDRTSDPGLSLALPPGREHAIVDTYSEGQLTASRTLADVAADAPLQNVLAPLPEGLVRIQARVDRFSSESAGARVLYVRRAGESDRAALEAVLTAARPHARGEATEAWVRELPPWAFADLQRFTAYALAPLETLRAPVPSAVSGRPAQVARVDHARNLARFGVAGCLVLAALIVGVSLMQRGLTAAHQASAIMAEAQDLPERPAHADRGERLRVITLALLVMLAFLTGALLVAAKSFWF